MEAIETLIWGTDDFYPYLRPYYEKAAEDGHIKIVGYSSLRDGAFSLHTAEGSAVGRLSFQIAVISTHNYYNARKKQLLQLGVPEKGIVDGRVFSMPGFDFHRFYWEGRVHGRMRNSSFIIPTTVYPRTFHTETATVKLGVKSYVNSASIIGNGLIEIGNFTSLSWNVMFELGLASDHNYRRVSTYGLNNLEFISPKQLQNEAKDNAAVGIGSDVWIGIGSKIKAIDSLHPITIGNGAVIASDSVVVKSVPPYAIVGGNPAEFIARFGG